ncbi:maleylpyruvate isomerase family mycothiol-dependent enzyme [Paenibacillus sp. TRM 82003]|uniref:maleylpyruvate isomerase family mycothiol-dependent enzyme n=1 Tax=Kineococcus sp. TRM81007 TaxID=2925831 RepID=UPI001F564DB1|nr:maleylpyruvate isomerase family mycothiol-dependent enzyme [Kineococcus sp. TRM81007]MCI2237957.1 maleylpyruvate isomerase family mycothiol-dependent enzyme [Kineococcus sp. TRM81007]MCI3925972.1 maleylpyruvate isomerase family mycothiol-dependent enzyme [Paenibacillus sp. TRM 82003]
MNALLPPTRVAMLPDVEAERLELADALDGLDAEQWRAPSLCRGWAVRDVVAHLTLSTRQTVPATAWRVLRARGSFDRAEAGWAREQARRYAPAELVGRLRATAGSQRRLRISSPMDPLCDVVVHRQDIARPLRLHLPSDPARVVAALRHAWVNPFYGRPQRRFAGLHLQATDADWSAGARGPRVRARAEDLLLVATGRPAGLAGLEGPGAAEVAARLGWER